MKLPARSPTAEAIRYALNHWDGVEQFLDDGRIQLDNNSVERAMRPVCLSRKNSLFAGSDEGGENWACLALIRARADAELGIGGRVDAARRTMPNEPTTIVCVGCGVAVGSLPSA